MPKRSITRLLEMLFINVVVPPRRPTRLRVFQRLKIIIRQRGAIKSIEKRGGVHLVLLYFRSMPFKDLQHVGKAFVRPSTAIP